MRLRQFRPIPPRGVIDEALDAEIATVGGFSTQLKYADHQRLRAIVRKRHLRDYPTEMLTDYECDKVIDVIAPQTAAYLIRQHLDGGKL